MRRGTWKGRTLAYVLAVVMLIVLVPVNVVAKAESADSGYFTDENGIMEYKPDADRGYDFKGYIKDSWQRVTFCDYGFSAMTYNGNDLTISANPVFVANGQAILVTYKVKNGLSTAVSDYRFYIAADTMIAGNDASTNEVDDDGVVIMQNDEEGISFFALSTTNGGTAVPTEYMGATVSYLSVISGADPSTVTRVDNVEDSAFVMYFPKDTLNPGEEREYTLVVGMGDTTSIRDIIANVKKDLKSAIDYENEVISDLESNGNYKVTIDGDDTIYEIVASDKGTIDFCGTDKNGNTYDLTGKKITLVQVSDDGESNPTEVDIVARPDAPTKPSDYEGGTESEPSKPSQPTEAEKIEIIKTTSDSITIAPKDGQQYAYSTDGGKKWITVDETAKDSDGNYVISSLPNNGSVKIRTRKAPSSDAPGSSWSEATEITLKQTVSATVQNYDDVYDGQEHSIVVTPDSDISNPVIEYSTSEEGSYSNTQPMFRNVGEYTVYYRVSAAGYYPVYGSASVKITKKSVTVRWGENITLTYDGTAQAPDVSASGIVDGDDCRAVVTNKQTNVGNYDASVGLEGAQAGNYEIENASTCNYSITKASWDAPTLSVTDETIKGKADGKIVGLTTDMEWRKVSDQTEDAPYTQVTDPNMTFGAGTYEVRYRNSENCNQSEAASVTIEAGRPLKVTVPADQTGYTVTVSPENVGLNESVTLTVKLKEGYAETSDFVVKVNGEKVELDANGSYTIPSVTDDIKITVEGIADVTAPNGEISIGDKRWSVFTDVAWSGIKVQDTQNVSIIAVDDGAGMAKTQYYISDKKLSEAEAQALASDQWKDYKKPLSINGGQKCIIYAKLTDKAGNTKIISTEGLTFEHTWPDAWTTVKEATATEAGKREKICESENCKAKKYDVIPATGTTEEPDPVQGTLEKEAEVAEKSPIQEATLNNTKKELLDSESKIFDDSEKTQIAGGTNARVWVEISNADIDELSEGDKAAVEEAIKEAVGDNAESVVFDAELFKQVGGGEKEKITDSGVKIKITIKIPEAIYSSDREYTIIRLHNGVAEVIQGILNKETGEFTFETDKFSTYAIAYKDVPASSSDNTTAENKKKLDAASTTVKETLTKLPATKVTSKEDLEAAIKSALSKADNKDASCEITEFDKVDATADAEGKVTGKVRVTVNGVSTVIPFSYTLAKLTDDKDDSDNVTPVKTSKTLLIVTGKSGKGKVKLTWNKITGATGYEVYTSVCDGGKNFKKTETKKLTSTIKNLNNKKSYKFYVRAYKVVDGKKVYLAKSPVIHVTMKDYKNTNVETIKNVKTSYKLTVGKKAGIRATTVKENKNKKLLAHAAEFRYYSSDTSVATVNKNGVITAKKTGKCTVYVVANNGVYKKINVTVGE